MSERAESLAELCRQFEINILYAFGSRAREVAEWLTGKHPVLPSGPADVDVGVKAARQLSVRDKA